MSQTSEALINLDTLVKQNGALVSTIADLSHKMALDYETIADQIMAIVGDVPEENNEEEQP